MQNLPDRFFVFLNMRDPICHHNLKNTGMIFSSAHAWLGEDIEFAKSYFQGQVDYFPYLPNEARSRMPISLFCHEVTYHYMVEYDAEVARKHYFPSAPSRLSCIFAFADMVSVEKAAATHGWDISTVRRFELEDEPATNIRKANMEIVSVARSLYRRSNVSSEMRNYLWNRYWTGGGSVDVDLPIIVNGEITRVSHSSGETWEYLIEGRLRLIGDL